MNCDQPICSSSSSILLLWHHGVNYTLQTGHCFRQILRQVFELSGKGCPFIQTPLMHTSTYSQLTAQVIIEGWMLKCFYAVCCHMWLSERNCFDSCGPVLHAYGIQYVVNGWWSSLNTLENCVIHICLSESQHFSKFNCLIWCKPARTMKSVDRH